MGVSQEARAGFGLRLVASIIDGIFISIGGSIIGSVFGGMFGGIAGGMLGAMSPEVGSGDMAAIGGIIGSLLGIMVGMFLLGTVYNLLEAFTGATVGKMLIGLKVGDAAGMKASLGKLFFRYAIKNIMYLCSVVAGLLGLKFLGTVGSVLGLIVFLGCFLVLTKPRQALHDLIAGTAVYPSKTL